MFSFNLHQPQREERRPLTPEEADAWMTRFKRHAIGWTVALGGAVGVLYASEPSSAAATAALVLLGLLFVGVPMLGAIVTETQASFEFAFGNLFAPLLMVAIAIHARVSGRERASSEHKPDVVGMRVGLSVAVLASIVLL